MHGSKILVKSIFSNDDVATDVAGDVLPDSGTGITSTCAFKNISFCYF